MIYPLRALPLRDREGGPRPISSSEDLRGVFDLQ
jgi:hypothetical protein